MGRAARARQDRARQSGLSAVEAASGPPQSAVVTALRAAHVAAQGPYTPLVEDLRTVALLLQENQDAGAEVDRLQLVSTLERLAASWVPQLAREAHAAGASWVDVGQVLGVSRQAARARFGVEEDAP